MRYSARMSLSRGYCQGDEKHVDRPPRYWARARREPTMLGINNGRRPQLDNTSERGIEGGSSPRTAASRPWIGYPAHDRSRRDRGHQLSIALGGQRRLRGSDSLVEPGARGGERRVALHDFGVRVEVGVESFRSERPLDKPTDGVCGVGHLLRGGHHARRGPHAGVLLRQAPCGAVEELPRAIELGQGLLCEWHGRSSDAERRDLRTTAATSQWRPSPR